MGRVAIVSIGLGMVEFSTFMQTAAAAFSAVAAGAAAYVAVRAFAFQKNVLFKKATCEQILKLLNQLHYLKSLAFHAVLDAPDDEIVDLKQRISKIRESVIVLESMVSPSASGDVQKLRDLVHGFREAPMFANDKAGPNTALRVQLDNAINALNRNLQCGAEMSIRILLTTAASTALAACATPGPPSVAPLSYEEVFAFESALLARESSAPQPPEKLFIQPANKVEACKLRTTQEQLDRSNFRQYWDGQCKDGFAFGLGRDIAISDTHHVEGITVLDGTDDDWSAPIAFYDYVNNLVFYRIGGSQFPAQTGLTEKLDNSIKGFTAQQALSVQDDIGNVFIIRTSSFDPQRSYSLSQKFGNIVYNFSDVSDVPTADPYALIFTAEVIDPKLGKPLVGVGYLADGSVVHGIDVGGEYEETLLPESYVNHLMSKYQEILTATSAASAQLQEAQQIEREYLFKACNGKSSIEGLDDATYTKICTWREQFREPYAIASANYQRQLETLRQQAATADQQRQIQEQISLQQQMLQQQQEQQAWDRLKQTTEELRQQTQERRQQTQRTLDGVTGWQAPQVQQPTTSNREKVVCNTVGSITICR